MASLALGVKFNAASAGTVDFVYSSAVTGYVGPAATSPAMVNGKTYHYRAESADLSQWEFGSGPYNSATQTIARTTITLSSTGAKVSFTAAPFVGIVPFPDDILQFDDANSFTTAQKAQAQINLGVREVLPAARTYYVRTDGSNSNTGLANTAGGAFLTIQKAVDTIASLDINAQTVTVQIADGTYTTAVTLKNVVGYSAAGSLVIQGNNATPANVIISTAADCFAADGISSVWDIKDLKITSSANNGINSVNGSTVRFGNLNIGACASYQLIANTGGKIIGLSSYAISGAANTHWNAVNTGQITVVSVTITITGTPAFGGQFAQAAGLAYMTIYGNTFSGAATGVRYTVNGNSEMFTNGGGATYLPGNAAGSTATGGLYL